MFATLRWRLTFFFTGLVLLTLLAGGMAASWIMSRQFEALTLVDGREKAQTLAPWLEATWNLERSWETLPELLVGDVVGAAPPFLSQVAGAEMADVQRSEPEQPWAGEWQGLEPESADTVPFYQEYEYPPDRALADALGLTVAQFYEELLEKSPATLFAERGLSREEAMRIYLNAQIADVATYGLPRADQILTLAYGHDFLNAWFSEETWAGNTNELSQKTALHTTWVQLVGDARIFLANPQHIIIEDSAGNERTGELLSESWKAQALPLHDWSDGTVIGSLLVASGQEFYNRQQQDFLRQVNRSLFAIGVVAALAAFGISDWLSRQITAPVKAITQASRELAEGRRLAALPVRSQDELGQMSATFNRMAASLAEQQELRRRLIHDLSHELNTPLAVIQLETEAWADEIQSADESLPRIHQEIDHLRRLLHDLNQVAEMDNAPPRWEMAPLEPAALVQDAARRWQTVATQAGLRLRTELPAGERCLVRGNPQRLGQVLNNLISNAVRYTEPGGEIVIGTGRDAATGNCLITVRDTGVGIDSADLPHIFERLWRADRSRNRAQGGRGLGLSIARQIVEQHGGHISAESTPGQGSTFTTTLPGVMDN
jgi:two-component system sensor histidine kinase BaeS